MADMKTAAPKFKMTLGVLTPEETAALPPEQRAPEVPVVETEAPPPIPKAVDHPLFHNLTPRADDHLVMFSQKPKEPPKEAFVVATKLREALMGAVTPAEMALLQMWGGKVSVYDPSHQYNEPHGIGTKEVAELVAAIHATWPGCEVGEYWRNGARAVTFSVKGIPRA